MSKHYYSLASCADAIQILIARAKDPSGRKLTHSQLELLVEQAEQGVETLRDPRVTMALTRDPGVGKPQMADE